jgi:laminin gamma 1
MFFYNVFFYRQVEDASEIESIAKQAYDTSTDAYEMARNAMEQQHATGNQIRVLEVQVHSMGEKLRTVQSLAGQTYRDASEAYNAAINIYQQAQSLEVPTVNEENLENQASKVQREAQRIRDEANRLIETNSQLLQETQDRRAQLEDLLARAEGQQQQLDAQLAEMDQHRAKALNAVSNGNDVLEDATNTLKTLNGLSLP